MGAILEHLMSDHGASMAEAKAALKPWTIEPILRNGEQVGEIMLQENEIHFAIDKSWRGLLGRRQTLKETLDRVLATREFLVTRLFLGDKLDKAVRFMGFEYTHSDSEYQYYWMDKESRNARA